MAFRHIVRFRFSYDLSQMGIFKSLFKSAEPKEEKILPWIPLTAVPQLGLIEEKSKMRPQLIFKHSTRCGISRMVINQFIEAHDFDQKDFDLYFLDLLSHREVSNEVAYKFQVLHESPQLIIVKNGVTVAHASHGGIHQIDLSLFR